MERPPQRYFCNKCGYVGNVDLHPGCGYLAYHLAPFEQNYIDQLERELALLKASPASAPADCSPTLTECPRCHNDVKKCDGVFAAPTPPVSEDRKDAERWVDVSKQLPINGDEVLCALTDGCVRVLEFSTHPEKRFIDRDTGKWWWIKVGHWMPLNKAPAMQEDKP